jgi:2-keto-4-pentenoate hydratase/2-oxohepta-3-ene-1,7-dioic acid hydratase in catechol pathway
LRIGRFESSAGAQPCVIYDEAVQPLDATVEVLDLLAATPGEREDMAASARAGEPIPLDEIRLLAPLRPHTIRDFITFEEHLEGCLLLTGREVPPEWYQRPAFYFSNPNAIVGPDEDVPVPPGCGLLDFELEVAAIVTRAGTDLTPEQARQHIGGYTILNDWSARDLQGAEMPVGLGPAKGKDFATSLGPWIVTTDELEPYRRGDRLELDLSALVNDREVGGDTLANMGWSFEQMAAFASRGATLLPGDVLGSGTCGSGCLVELWGRNGGLTPPPLQPDDRVTLNVTGIGALSNRVVAGRGEAVPIAEAQPPNRRVRPWSSAPQT